MNKTINLLLLLVFYLTLTQSQTEDEHPTVSIKNGRLKGRLTQTIVNKKRYYAFQGIPYALPPVGDLRFKPPVPASDWDGILETDEDEKRCIQSLFGGSEDCLYINVFTPQLGGTTLLPVMVWIYGGYFVIGDSIEHHFGPDFFLEEDVVVVTFNYRLGVFGYLSTEDGVSPGNYGLKDQILALKWVRDNVASFGGDPGKITVFGESAGAVSISYLLQTNLTTGLFQRAILQSGTTLNPWALSRNPRATAIAIGRILGFSGTNATSLVDILRRVDARVLQFVSFSTQLIRSVVENPLDTVVFGPSVEPNVEGAVVTTKSHRQLELGLFNKVPLIVGFNSEESVYFRQVIDDIRPWFITLLSYRLVPRDMNIQNFLERLSVGTLIRRAYFGKSVFPFSEPRMIRFLTDDLFVRPINQYVSILSKFNPVFFYRFSYEGNLGVNGEARTQNGVGHSEELKYLWEQSSVTEEPSYFDLMTRKRLVKLWTNFAKFGNPTPTKDPLFQNVTWPISLFQNIRYFDIGKDIQVASNLTEYKVRFWDALYRLYGQPPFDTY